MNLKTFSAPGPSIPGLARPAPDLGLLRTVCHELLADAARADQQRIQGRLQYMRRADDMGNLRRAMFDVIAHLHSESVARERIDVLDKKLA